MITTIANFGDHVGVQIPKSLLKNVHISENEDVKILVRDNCLIIKQREDKKHLTTK